jgi:hypothetical protein
MAAQQRFAQRGSSGERARRTVYRFGVSERIIH